MAVEDGIRKASNYIIMAVFAVVGFFVMLSFMSSVSFVGNAYGWVFPVVTIIAYIFFIYFGFKKAGS